MSIVGQKLGEAWNQSVVIENRGGAGGNIGADVVAKAASDGYTILMTSGSIFTVNPSLYKKMPFDAQKDFIAVTNVAGDIPSLYDPIDGLKETRNASAF